MLKVTNMTRPDHELVSWDTVRFFGVDMLSSFDPLFNVSCLVRGPRSVGPLRHVLFQHKKTGLLQLFDILAYALIGFHDARLVWIVKTGISDTIIWGKFRLFVFGKYRSLLGAYDSLTSAHRERNRTPGS